MPELIAVRDAAIQEFLTTEFANSTPFSFSARPRLNVTAISIATKIRAGRDTGQECIRFYVERKIPEGPISAESLLPKTYHGVPTDVIESGRFMAAVGGNRRPRTKRAGVAAARPLAAAAPALMAPGGPLSGAFRPIRPGISCGFQYPPPDQERLMGGTLGALVEKNGITYILSNNHVLADSNALPLGSPIFQAALLDGGDPKTDRVAALSQFFPLNTSAPNLVDCAIAAVDKGVDVDPTFPPNVGQLASADPIAASKGNSVEKIGWDTGYTQGAIYDTGVSVPVTFSFGTVILTNQIFFQGLDGEFFADGGDSGSVVVDRKAKRGVALIMAGSDQLIVGSPLDTVLNSLGVTLRI